MSKFTGKCDFYDQIEVCGIDSVLNADIEIGNKHIQLKSLKECALYYPNIISMSCASNDHSYIKLTDDAWFNIEEKRNLKIEMEWVKKEYRRCKRKKEEFVIDDVYEKIFNYSFTNEEKVRREIIKRVKEYGNKANIDGLHFSYYLQYYRKEYYNELISLGYDEKFAHQWAYEERKNI